MYKVGMKTRILKYVALTGALLAACVAARAQRIEPIPFGDFEQWVVRYIDESGVIGGKKRPVYAVAPTDTIRANTPYKNKSASPWGSSNVMAHVMGIYKTSNTVFPEKRGEGYCARLDTRLETCKVLGLVNITVLASGSLFLGEADEPIKSASDPLSKILMGIPFTGHPKALMLDYKARISTDDFVTKATGLGSSRQSGRDEGEFVLYLQHRWEDAKGNVYARRVGTIKERVSESTDGWVNDHKINIRYGDITGQPDYKPYMGLLNGDYQYCCRNSKGKIVPIQEVGWGKPDDEVTHIILMLSSGSKGAYIGSVGNSLCVDNVRLVY